MLSYKKLLELGGMFCLIIVFDNLKFSPLVNRCFRSDNSVMCLCVIQFRSRIEPCDCITEKTKYQKARCKSIFDSIHIQN